MKNLPAPTIEFFKFKTIKIIWVMSNQWNHSITSLEHFFIVNLKKNSRQLDCVKGRVKNLFTVQLQFYGQFQNWCIQETHLCKKILR